MKDITTAVNGSDSELTAPLPQPRPHPTQNGARPVAMPRESLAAWNARRARRNLRSNVLMLLATCVEVAGIYLWLRFQAAGELWWGTLSLVVGEVVETAMFSYALHRRPEERWGPLPPAARGAARGRRVQRATWLAGVGEIGIWLLWLTAAKQVDQELAAAALLVLMHFKHQIESAAVKDLPNRSGLWGISAIFASAAEVAGAVACLALIEDGHVVPALAALFAGIAVEHAVQLDGLRWEMRARDVRLPRDRRWKPPPRRRPIELYVSTHFAWLWRLVQRIRPLERRVNRFAIDRLVRVIEPRPNRLSTKAPYTSWSSLTDREYSGRHLPPVPVGSRRPATDDDGPPRVADVARLFERSGEMVECPKSTVLFSLFAQWFTDGFLRSRRQVGQTRDPRRSDSTSEIDLVQLYGRTCEQTRQLRGVRGLLKSQMIDGEEYPEYYCRYGLPRPEFDALLEPLGFANIWPADKDRLFAVGTDATGLGNWAFTTLFLREHNRIARRLGAEHPSWDDDRVFETTRNVVIVLLLKVVVEEYINHITPNHFRFRLQQPAPDAPWCRTNWMAIEFNLLYRWHSLVPSELHLNGRSHALSETLWNTALLTDVGLGPFMTAASAQPAGRIGLFNTDPFLVARAEAPTIQQARRARLASYNDYRRLCGLPPFAHFEEISDDAAVVEALALTYETVEDVEFYPGLFAEQTLRNGILPRLMQLMVAFDAFSQALTNPLLAPQVYNEQTFSETGWEIIQTTNGLSDLVDRNTPSCSERHVVSFTRHDYARS